MKTTLLILVAAILVCPPIHAQRCDEREIPDDAWGPPSISAEDLVQMMPRRMLIMRAFWESGPEALVVEDPGEVGDLFALLAGNQTVAHACGFHWSIVFEDSSRRIVQHLHNKECEAYRNFHLEIQNRLADYFRRVDKAPTHYLLNVELDPSADPSAVAAVLERDGRRAFLLEHPDSRFPRLQITRFAHDASSIGDETAEQAIEARAREELDAVIELLKARENARVFTEPARFMSSSGGGQYEAGLRATVVFPLSFDASRLARYREQLASGAIDAEGMKAMEEVEPPFERPASYTLSLASPKPYTKELAESIRAASRAVRNVSPVESTRMDE